MKKYLYVIILTALVILSGCSSGNAAQADHTSKPAETSVPAATSVITPEQTVGQETTPNELTGPKMDKGAPAANFSGLAQNYTELPEYKVDDNTWRPVALRQCDLSKLDLHADLDKLLHAEFDMQTKWPESMPEEFDPQAVMDMARTPGLQINTLHEQGITGKGIGIAIIDQPLLLEHNEYKDRIKAYEVIGYAGDYTASMHGSLMTSIAAGKDCGVAPESDIYYFCGNVWNEAGDKQSWLEYASAVDRVLEINTTLPEANKIRVISISASWKPEDIGFTEMEASIQKAREQGILVLNCNLFMESNYSMCFQGLDRSPLESKENKESYSVVAWEQWLSMEGGGYGTLYEEQFTSHPPKEILLVPMNSFLGAAPTGADDYTFYRVGGWSSAEPYLAGIYALACQTDPEITPEQFWSAALLTGDLKEVEVKGTKYTGKMINPVKLVESFRQ